MISRSKLQSFLEITIISFLDLASILLLFKIGLFLRTDVLPLFYAVFPEASPSGDVTKIWWVFLIWMFFYYYEGLYTKRFSYWDEIRILWKVSFFATVGVFAITSIGKMSGDISRTVTVLMGVMSIFVLPLVRIVGKKILRYMGLLKRRVLILGAGETGKLIAKALMKEPNYGYNVIGYLDDDPVKVGSMIEGIKVHKGIDAAGRYLKACSITDLVIAMPGAGRDRLQGLINSLQHSVDRILFVPDVFGMAVVGTTLQHFFQEQALALEVKNNLAQPLNYITKRAFDYIVGVSLLLLLLVPILLISLMIRLKSRGAAFYMQPRIGKNGKVFMCYKFRTMYNDADERLQDILENDPVARAEWNTHWKLKDDPRVTEVGKFLRKTSLDELPQIFNVLNGDMSLVGPRPYMPSEEKRLGDFRDLILSVLPGITGLWQVSGRSNTTHDNRISLDSWYVRNWDLWLDVVILMKTIPVVFKKEGAC
jgi:undecaprenyl-phosphate galactose phosphotransferase